MSQTLTAVLADDVGAPLRITLIDNDGTIRVPTKITAGSGLFKSLRRALANGTGSGQGNKCFYQANRSLAAGGNDNWVLNGAGANTTDRYGNVITWLKVKYALLRLTAPAAGVSLLLGNHATHPWAGWWGGGTTVLTVKVWTQHVDDLDGLTVNVNDALRVNNPGGAPVIYDIVLLGTG
jgi:hypothetical protein